MTVYATSIPKNLAVDEVTLHDNAGVAEVMDAGIADKQLAIPTSNVLHNTAENSIEIVRLDANASITPSTYNAMIPDAFTTAAGANSSVDTTGGVGNTDATFSSDKYQANFNSSTVAGGNRIYLFNEASGAIVDSGTDGVNLTAGSGVTQNVTGKISKCISVASGTTYGNGANGTYIGITRTSPWSMSYWFKMAANPSGGDNVFQSATNGSGGFTIMIQMTTAGKVFIVVTTAGGGNDRYWQLDTTTVCDGAWHHIFLNSTGGDNLTAWIDNVSQSISVSGAGSGYPTGGTPAGTASFYNQTGGQTAYFDAAFVLVGSNFSAGDRANLWNGGSGAEQGGSISKRTVKSVALTQLNGAITQFALFGHVVSLNTGNTITYTLKQGTGVTLLSSQNLNTVLPCAATLLNAYVLLEFNKGSGSVSDTPSAKGWAAMTW